MSKVLILGGTGALGQAISKEFENAEVSSVQNPNINYYNENRFWDLVIDLYTFDENHVLGINSFRNRVGHYVLMSSTLVYDRSKLSFERIKSDASLAEVGKQGGYVDHKLVLENGLKNIEDMPWTVFRPYHILGKGTGVGCLPPNNRTPNLIERMSSGSLNLSDGGRLPINIVNPDDIAHAIKLAAGNSSIFFKSYNLVNPEEIIARDYYLEIAKMYNINLEINEIPSSVAWKNNEWALTTLPHLYDVSNLKEDLNFVPNTGLKESLEDALRSKVISTKTCERMHQLPTPELNSYFA